MDDLDSINERAVDLFEDNYSDLAYRDPKLLLPESPFEAKDFELTHCEAVKYMMHVGHSDGDIVGIFVNKYGFEIGVRLARNYVSE